MIPLISSFFLLSQRLKHRSFRIIFLCTIILFNSSFVNGVNIYGKFKYEYGFLPRSSMQPERKYSEENTSYKVRNIKRNIYNVKAPFDKEHALEYFSSCLKSTCNTFQPRDIPEGDIPTMTKQVATLGPATNNPESIRSLSEAGVDVFRLNFSHDSRLSKFLITKMIRQMETSEVPEGYPFNSKVVYNHKSILGDIQGPKLRIGKFMPNLDVPGMVPGNKGCEFVELKEGDLFTFDAHEVLGTKSRVQLDFPEILKRLKVGHKIILDDGNLSMTVVSTNPDEPSVTAVVKNDYKLFSRKGFSVPQVVLPVEFLDEKDVKDAVFCVAIGVDFLGVSFVQDKSDINYLVNILNDFYTSEYYTQLRERLDKLVVDSFDLNVEDSIVENILNKYYNESFLPKKELFKTVEPKENLCGVGIIPKIEKQAALDNIHDILKLSDGLMVARGDLGIETDLANLPIIQKRLVQLCRVVYRKPCIVATQMLETMRSSPMPTRAEVSDVSNAVFDGADAVMLSAESATGEYPKASVKVQRRVLFSTESDPYFQTMQVIRSNLIDEDLLSSIESQRPGLFSVMDDLLKFDMNEKASFNTKNNHLLTSVKQVEKLISDHSVDSIFVVTDDSLQFLQWISSKRHMVPIFLLTTNERLSRQSQLTWGVKSKMIPEGEDPKNLMIYIVNKYPVKMSKVLYIESKNNDLDRYLVSTV